MHDWVENLCVEGLISDLSLHAYEKEVERYGGLACLEAVEAFFCADSICCIQLMQLGVTVPQYAIGALGVLQIINHFYATPEEMESFLADMQQHAHLLTGARPFLGKLTDWAMALFVSSETVEDDLLMKLKECIQTADPALAKLKTCLESSGMNQQQKIYILENLMHMRCNRLMGIDQEQEKRACVLAYAISKKINNKRRNLCLT